MGNEQIPLHLLLDGNLTRAEALGALREAAMAATDALPKALAQCQTDEQRAKVMDDRDTVQIAYLSSLLKSLALTGPKWEKAAADTETAAAKVRKQMNILKNVNEALNLLTDLVRLAGTLALAFA